MKLVFSAHSHKIQKAMILYHSFTSLLLALVCNECLCLGSYLLMTALDTVERWRGIFKRLQKQRIIY